MSEQTVRPKRRKIALACEPCRERKARCDGGRPICSTCQQRSLKAAKCVYKGFDDSNEKNLRDRIRRLELACQENGIDTETLRKSPWHQTSPAQPAGSTSSPAAMSASLDSPSYHNEPNPMNPTISATSCVSGVTAMGTISDDSGLANLSDMSQDFYGSSSAASFLHETCRNMGLRSSQRPAMKRPSAHRDAPQSSQFRYANVTNFQLPPRSLADHLIECYFERVYYLYPYFDRPAFEHAYNSLWQPADETAATPDRFRDLGIGSPLIGDSKTAVFHASLNAIFALGCPFSNLPASEKVKSAEVFFSRSKSHVGFDLLEMHNVGVVQLLLLVAQALQGTSFPNRCWNAAGAAYRIALALGLHTDPPYTQGESHDQEIRRRTWHGCIVLDMLVSMTFGRPSITGGLSASQINDTATLDLAVASKPEELKVAFLSACARLSLVLNQILSQVYPPSPRRAPSGGISPCPIRRETIAELEKQLVVFENSLPSPLSWNIARSGGPEETDRILLMQRNVLHARFLYARLLLHRQLFTRALACSADNRDNTPSGPDQTATHQPFDVVLQQSFETECARRCIHSSSELINLIHGGYKSNETGAWWWNGLYACTSGLILLLSQSCPQIQGTLSPSEFGTLWTQCCEILEALAAMSASARASLDLLTRVYNYIQPHASEGAGPRETVANVDLGADNHFNDSLYGMTTWDGFDVTGPFFYSWDILDGYPLGDADQAAL